jgi:hypothetical protein
MLRKLVNKKRAKEAADAAEADKKSKQAAKEATRSGAARAAADKVDKANAKILRDATSRERLDKERSEFESTMPAATRGLGSKLPKNRSVKFIPGSIRDSRPSVSIKAKRCSREPKTPSGLPR